MQEETEIDKDDVVPYRMTAKEIVSVMKNAKLAQPAWENTCVKERRELLKKVKKALVERLDTLAECISDHNGKTRIDAMATEVVPAAMALDYYLKNAAKWLKPKRTGMGNIFFANKRSAIHRVPYGVIGIISPWNYPFSIPFSEVVMGLLAGNCVILKVAEETVVVGKMIQDIMDEAGLPDGVFSYVQCNGSAISKIFLENGIDKLFFTGSVGVGKQLMKKAAETLTPVNLELGGNDAMIVCDDASIHRAAGGAAWAGFQNAGQSCGGVERIYVHERIYGQFLEELSRKTNDLTVGIDHNFDVDVGRITTKKQVETINAHVQDALEKGAVVEAEGKIRSDDKFKDFLVAPKVLSNVTHDMRIMTEETFGPVVGVMPFSHDDEAISLANDSDLGLTASIWTRDRKRANRIALRVKAGAITVNDHLMSHGLAETPWGGFKNSGIGRSHGAVGFNEMTQPQVLVHDLFSFLPRNLWWFPVNKSLYEGLKGIAYVCYGQYSQKLLGIFKLLRILPRAVTKK